jgi:hypothetical protein
MRIYADLRLRAMLPGGPSKTPLTAFSCEICAGSLGRKQLLGQIFDKETTRVVESTRQKVEGLLGIGQCDG